MLFMLFQGILQSGFWECHCKVHTLRERELHPVLAAGLTKEWKWSSHFLWEPGWDAEGDGKHIPVQSGGIFRVLDLPGRENHFQFISAHAAPSMGTKEKAPKLGVVPGIWSPAGKRDKAELDQSSCGWASQPWGEGWQCPAPVGSVLLWRMDLLEELFRMRVGSPSSQDLCPPRVYLTLNPPHNDLSTPPRVRAVGFSLSPRAWVIFIPKNTTKIPLQPGRAAPLLSPPSLGRAAFQGCASLPLHPPEGAWIYCQQTPFIWLKAAKMQHNAQCFRPEKNKTQVITLNVQSTE